MNMPQLIRISESQTHTGVLPRDYSFLNLIAYPKDS